MEISRSLSRRLWSLPAAMAAVVALAAVGGFFGARRSLDRSTGRLVQAAATAGVSSVSSALRVDSAVLFYASQSIAGSARPPSESVAAALATVTASARDRPLGIATVSDGRVRLVTVLPGGSAAALGGADLTAHPAWQLALEQATDLAGPQDGIADLPGAGPTVLIALPLYGPGPTPLDVGSRRAALQGYVVTTETPQSLGGSGLTDLGPGVAARLAQGSLPFGTFGAAATAATPSSAATATTTAHGVPWTVTTWSTAGAPVLPWVILLAGLALAAALGLVSAAWSRRRLALTRMATARAEELGLVARTGPLLQQSLELGDLLPLFVVELADELDLDEVTVSLLSDGGRLIPAFSFGGETTGVPTSPADVVPAPASVARGEHVVLPLRRGGRLVGTLAGRARSGLGPSRMQALTTVADLLGAALGNVRLFREEQEMVARLRDLDRMKMTFLGSVSHELRTSVTAIVGFADLLTTGGDLLDDNQKVDFLERIKRNAESLGVLIDDVLDFARLERGSMTVSRREVVLSELVPRVVGQMSSIVRRQVLSETVAPDVVALVDPGAFERILVNLLSNAAKYTPEGTDVSVTLEREGGSALLTVADRGPGIPPEERERIFDLFYRADNATTQAVRGVGIGLALARQLVEMMKGDITVDETPGGGARFRVRLPLAEETTAAGSSDNRRARLPA